MNKSPQGQNATTFNFSAAGQIQASSREEACKLLAEHFTAISNGDEQPVSEGAVVTVDAAE